MRARGFAFCLGTLAAMIGTETLVPGTDGVNELGAVDAVLVLGWALFFARWCAYGGSITVDYGSRQIRWRRPLAREGAARSWRFDEVLDATPHDRAAGETVSLQLPGRQLEFKVGRGGAVGIAASLDPHDPAAT